MNERLPEYYDPIVRALAADIYQAFPALQQRYGEKGWKHTIEDNEHHFRHLEAAYAIRDQQVFVDYALWLNGILTKHGMTTYLVIDNFERIQTVIQNQLETKKEQAFQLYLEAAIEHLKTTDDYDKSDKRPFKGE
ncbi:hypothetical protein JOC54_004337 [Alkalihalobacillus xiaoxiensis]|uniref:Uncharacterized protein n=1 Tax=Shouchella xiaoxiensis TaxID=766895 RepID=A0ABS2SZT1_9BACI|nr:hypothetical protein [Shouchella xiaoxiensis]MBM7841038.1 hypothetical protein [Shouchella xiaoxiensis]